jgi:hypothetical protein
VTGIASWDAFAWDAAFAWWSGLFMFAVVIAMPLTFTWRAYGTVEREAATRRRANEEKIRRADEARAACGPCPAKTDL